MGIHVLFKIRKIKKEDLTGRTSVSVKTSSLYLKLKIIKDRFYEIFLPSLETNFLNKTATKTIDPMSKSAGTHAAPMLFIFSLFY